MSFCLIDYLKQNASIPVTEKPLNIHDALAFSQIPLLNLSTIDLSKPRTIKEVSEEFFAEQPLEERTLGLIVPRAITGMFAFMAKSPRYQDMYITNFEKIFDDVREEQFVGVTLVPYPGLKYILYSATDDTIVAWKENFNLLNLDVIPAQTASAEYLKREADGSDLVVCGHSKGGNLSMYATVTAEIETYRKIKATYNFDGPGFMDKMIQNKDYQLRKNKLLTIVPESSVVGMLLTHEEPLVIVKSVEQYLYQHDVFSWCLTDTFFETCETLSEQSLGVDRKVKAMMASMSIEDRITLIESTYHWLITYKSKTLTDLIAVIPRLFPAFFKIEKSKRKLVAKIMFELMKDKNIRVGAYHSARRLKKYQARQKVAHSLFDEVKTKK